MKLKSLIVGLLLALPANLTAQETGEDLRGVGLIVAGGNAGCTGTLVEPDLVLTAAHCLMGRDVQGQLFSPEQFVFSPATHDGSPGQGHRANAIAVHPVYLVSPEGSQHRVRRDIGLIRLKVAVPVQQAKPLPLSPPDVFPNQGFLLSFRGPLGGPLRQRRCPVISEADQFLVLGCEVTGGESGAPFLIRTATGLITYAVVSSRFRLKKQPVALAIVAGHGFDGMLAAMQGGQGR